MKRKIGFIGAGLMGRGMARSLIREMRYGSTVFETISFRNTLT